MSRYAALLIFCALAYTGWLRITHRISWSGYRKHTFKKLHGYQNKKKEYLEDVLSLILDFQKLMQIEREQQVLSEQLKKNYRILESHRRMLERMTADLYPLKVFSGIQSAEECEASEGSWIDFTAEPREEDYYKMFSHNRGRAEINYSGREVVLPFSFIIRVKLEKET